MALNPNVVIVAPGDLITSVHLNNVRANLDRLDTSKLSLTGGAVTGPVVVTAASPQLTLSNASAAGDASLSLTVGGIFAGLVKATATDVTVSAPGANINLWVAGSERARLDASALLVGKTAANPAVAGTEVGASGKIVSTMATASVNQQLTHIGTGDANAVSYTLFQRTGAVTLGNITQVSTTGVNYGTTSDERLKDVLGPVADPLDVIARLNPVRFAWKATGEEQDGFLAHEVQAVVPWAVTGERGAVHPAPPLVDVVDDDGTVVQIADPSYPPEGTIDPQQLDASKLVPLLVAAVQALTARVAELEAAA